MIQQIDERIMHEIREILKSHWFLGEDPVSLAYSIYNLVQREIRKND